MADHYGDATLDLTVVLDAAGDFPGASLGISPATDGTGATDHLAESALGVSPATFSGAVASGALYGDAALNVAVATASVGLIPGAEVTVTAAVATGASATYFVALTGFPVYEGQPQVELVPMQLLPLDITPGLRARVRPQEVTVTVETIADNDPNVVIPITLRENTWEWPRDGDDELIPFDPENPEVTMPDHGAYSAAIRPVAQVMILMPTPTITNGEPS